MRRLRLISLLLMLPGCMSQPRALPLIGAPSVSAGHRLMVELALPRQVQATVNRNLVSMIDHYTATLLLWDGSSFVPLATPLSSTTTEQVRPKFAFDHLGPGRYQVRAIAYDATNTPLTSEGSADIDLTGNDVGLAPHVTVALTMLPTTFSAALPLPSNTTPGAVPGWATGLEAVVSVGGTEIARHSYPPGQSPVLKNLAAGVSYDVTVTASNGSGYTDDDSYTYYAAPNAASLDDAPTHTFSWPPLVSTYTVGAFPDAVAVDGGGNAWVANFNSSNVSRISSTGVVTTFAAGAGPNDVVVDPSGNVWVANCNATTVTRISSTGTRSTFTVGSSPFGLAVDAGGNVWVANSGNARATRISSTGSLSTYNVGTTPKAVAVDGSGNAWVPNSGSANLTRISSTGSISTISVGTTPEAVTVDGSGNVWVANNGSANVTRISSTGSLSTFPVGTNPIDVLVDGAGNTWVANQGSANVTCISSTGSIATFTVGVGPNALAIDGSGNIWVTNSGTNTVSRISSTGLVSTFTAGANAFSLAVDAFGSVWVTNLTATSVTRLQF